MFLLLILFLTHQEVRPHGRLMEPPNRSSIWRFPEFSKQNPPANYNDNELFCGSIHQTTNPGTECGVCGDPISESKPRDNEIGGKFYRGIIVRKYKSGETINTTVELTRSHKGFMEWRLCSDTSETQECFNKNLLLRADGQGSKVFVEDTGIYRAVLQLPKINCSHCVIQWNYRAGNNWGNCNNGSSGLGCGQQETFRGCSDVAVVGETQSIEMLTKSVDAVKMLRCNVAGFFETIATGAKMEGGVTTNAEDRERLFKSEFLFFMQKMVENVKELDANMSALTPPIGPFNLGNTTFVNQEVAPDRVPLYSQLVDSYKWMEKVHEYSGIAGPILSQNSMKRTYMTASISSKRRRTLVNSFTVPTPEVVNNSIAGIANSFSVMDISISRPLGANAVLNITLGRTLKAIVILKGWLIEWVVIRGTNEDMNKEDGSLDLWSESRHRVFRKVTENANAAMLHFCAPTHPELSVRSFMTWLHSYITLFTQPCKKCSLHLQNNLPPTWRDLRSLDPYHTECK